MNKRKAFEVEDLIRRENYTFVYDPVTKQVDMYNTSVKVGRRLEMSYREGSNHLIPIYPNENNFVIDPLECVTAYTYFESLYDKSLDFSQQVAFLGWVDPDSFEPID